MKYQTAYDLAVAELLRADPAERALAAGGSYDPASRSLTLTLCGRRLTFRYDSACLAWADTGQAFDLSPGEVAVLHYLVKANGKKPAGDLVPYRELWGAATQSGPFVDRSEQALAESYGAAPEAVLARAKSLGTEAIAGNGDARLDILVLPHIPVSVLLYGPDEDFPAGAKILFDSVINDYLPTEDVTWVAELVSGKLRAD